MPFIPDNFKKGDRAFVPAWMTEDLKASHSLARGEKGLEGSFAYRGFPEAGALLLKGGQCIIPYKGLFPLDMEIRQGKIVSMGEDLSAKDATTVSLKGKYVFPGILDPHVHLGIYADFHREIVTETRSALLNGITTLGLYIFSQDSYLPILDDTIRRIERDSFCDVFIHLAILNRRQLEEIPLYYSRYGITSFKTWMCGIPGLIPDAEDDFLLDLMEGVASLGKEATLNVHAENHRIVTRATERLKRTDPMGRSLSLWEQSHPGFAEAEAIQRAATLSAETGTRIYFVHLSSKQALRVAGELRRHRKDLFFETTSPYLTLCLEQDLNLLYKMSPPIRKKEDQDALWDALREDILDTVGTDHTPMTLAEKRAAPHVWGIPPGYPAVGTHLPSLLHEAGKRAFPLTRLIEKMTAEPAKIFGLFPKKGTLLPGSDADLVIMDPLLEKRVSPETASSRSDYALHEGKTWMGWPMAVIQSGHWITPADPEGHIAGGRGRYLRREV